MDLTRDQTKVAKGSPQLRSDGEIIIDIRKCTEASSILFPPFCWADSNEIIVYYYYAIHVIINRKDKNGERHRGPTTGGSFFFLSIPDSL